MAPRYYVRIKEPDGTPVAILDHWRTLRFTRRVNHPGSSILVFDDDHSVRPLVELDGQIEVYRKDPAMGISDWQREFEGFHRTTVRQLFTDDDLVFTSYGVGYLDLLARRIVAYHSDTSGSKKMGPADDIMKQFVNENAGPGAASPPRLGFAGTIPGLTLQADQALASFWEGGRAYQNLLEVLQGIADEGAVDFDIVGTGDGTYEFRTYMGQRGSDRRALNISATTGLNSAGNPPVIFSVSRASVEEATYSFPRGDEVNVAFALGRGEGSNREVVALEVIDRADDSPLNRREGSVNASNETSAAALASRAREVLAGKQAREELSAKVLQQPSQAYGRQYFFGDLVTVRFVDREVHKKIVGVTIEVSADAGGETITPEFADIPF